MLAYLLLAMKLALASATMENVESALDSCVANLSITRWLGDAAYDVLADSSITLFAFGVGFALIKMNRSMSRQHHQQNFRVRNLKEKTGESSPTRKFCPGSIGAAIAAPAKAPSRCQPPSTSKAKITVRSAGHKATPSTSTYLRNTDQSSLNSIGTCATHGSQHNPNTSLKAEADALASAVRCGRTAELPQLFDGARTRLSDSVSATSRAREQVLEEQTQQLLLPALRACAGARRFSEALVTYDRAASHIGAGSAVIWSVLLYSAVESQAFERCQGFFRKLSSQGNANAHDFVNMVRCHAHFHNMHGLQGLLEDMAQSSLEIDAWTRNRALAACCAEGALELSDIIASDCICSEPIDAVGFNTLMTCNARAGRVSRCFELRAEMDAENLKPSEVTFGILMEACVSAGELDRAKCVFEDLCSSGVQINAVHCTAFIKGLIRGGKIDEARNVVQEMLGSPDVKPDLVTFSTLMRAYAEVGDVNSALELLQQMLAHDIKPDEIVFNSVLSCCSTPPAWKPAKMLELFDDLLALGMRPTTSTVSIFLTAMVQADAWRASIEFLTSMQEDFGLAPEMRLYTQLAQACIKARKRSLAFEIFETMLTEAQHRNEKVHSTLTGRLLRRCAFCNDFQTASMIHAAAIRAQMPVESDDLKTVWDVAVQRGKTSLLSADLSYDMLN